MKKVYTILSMFILVTLFSGQVMGQTTRTWDGGAPDDNWNSADNWSSNTVPTSADDVVIPVNSTVIVNTSSAICKSLVLSPVSNGSQSGAKVTFTTGSNQ
jgi:hypothetical protein